MKTYKNDAGYYVGVAYFYDGHKEGIVRAFQNDNEQHIMFTTESDKGFLDTYICTERLEAVSAEFSPAGVFYVRRTTFWQQDCSRNVLEHYMSGEILYSGEDVYVPAAIARIKLYEEDLNK